MRRRRVEISSRMRWSSRITQSETNSSMPCRVSLSGWSRSAVMEEFFSDCVILLDQLLYAVPGQLVGLVPLGGNDRGQPFLLEPVEQAADFGAHRSEERRGGKEVSC